MNSAPILLLLLIADADDFALLCGNEVSGDDRKKDSHTKFVIYDLSFFFCFEEKNRNDFKQTLSAKKRFCINLLFVSLSGPDLRERSFFVRLSVRDANFYGVVHK